MLMLLTLWAAVGQAAGGLPVTVEPGSPAAAADAAAVDITLRFEADVPEALEIVRLGRDPGGAVWQVGEVLRATARDNLAIVGGPAGADVLLLIRAPGRAGYLLEGPLRWPQRPATHPVGGVWRRTIRGAWPAAATGLPVWIGGADEPPREAWPECRAHGASGWECVGVPLGTPGAVVAHGASGLFYGLAAGTLSADGVEAVSPAAASWGRMIVVGRTDRIRVAPADGITLTARQATEPPMRPRSVRLDVTVDKRVTTRSIGPGVFWISGSEAPADTWIEVAGRGRAPIRIPVPDVAAGPLELPLRVDLDRALSLTGRVLAADGMGAGGAHVLLSRLLPDAPRPLDPKAPAKRLPVAEATSDGDGHFRFDDLGSETYEVVAVHATLGRGERRVPPEETEIDVRLKRPSVVTGRVTQDGAPAAGVVVSIAPDLFEVGASEDLTELMGGQTTTGGDGRFTVAVPPRGSSEVRVGSGGGSVKRFPLGPADTLPAVIDLGVIPIDVALVARLVLEGADGCELTISGPVGRSGLSVVRADRVGPAMFEARVPEPGQWLISARCGKQGRSVHPSLFEAGGSSPMTVPLTWRQ